MGVWCWGWGCGGGGEEEEEEREEGEEGGEVHCILISQMMSSGFGRDGHLSSIRRENLSPFLFFPTTLPRTRRASLFCRNP